MQPSPEELDDAVESIIENDKSDRAKEKYTMSNTKGDTGEGRSPVHTLVDRLGDKPGQYKTTKQVAEELDTSESTIRRISKKDDGPGPSQYTKMGTLWVALYTKEDIKKIAKYLQNQHRIVPAEEVR